jgi:hypothetical protein
MHSCIPASDGWIDRMYIGSLPNENPVESGKASKQNAVAPQIDYLLEEAETTHISRPSRLLYDYLPHECGEVYC